jgi:hypothetical protein
VCYNRHVTDTPLNNLTATITSKLADRPNALTSVQKIALSIESTGMSLEDCTLLARMTSQELAALSDEIPEIPIYFRLKRVQYKEALLKVLHAQATELKDVKIAMYLLETNFSEEYDPATKKAVAKRRSEDDGSDLQKLMKLVRTSAPNSPVIESNTIAADVVAKETGYDDIKKLVHG